MSKTAKWLIAAGTLIIVGGILFTGALMLLQWDFEELSTMKYETHTYAITEDYQGIAIVTDTADVTLVPSTDGSTTIACHEDAVDRHVVRVVDGVLRVEPANEKRWYHYIGIRFGTPTITITLPTGEYGALSHKASTGDVTIPDGFTFESMNITASTGDVKSAADAMGDITVHTSTGHITLERAAAGGMDLTVSTGKVAVSDVTCTGDVRVAVSTGKTVLTDVTCASLTTTGSTGDIHLTDVVATGKFDITRSTGDVTFENADAAEIYVNTDTGDVEGTLRSDKVFLTETDTGHVDVPKTITGGRCEITTDTGDIRIRVK